MTLSFRKALLHVLTQEHVNGTGQRQAVKLGLAQPGRRKRARKLGVCCTVLCGRWLPGRASCLPKCLKGGRDLALGCRLQ